MRGLQLEYIAKGVFLGLLLFVARQAATPDDVMLIAVCLLGGLGAAVCYSGFWLLREGHQVKGRLLPFFLFLTLENPTLIYAGIILGLSLAPLGMASRGDDSLLISMIGAGGVLGFVLGMLREVPNRWTRIALVLIVAAALPAAGLYWLSVDRTLILHRETFGAALLIGLPFFYLLTFAGRAEESEVEIAAICAALGAGFYLLDMVPPGLQKSVSVGIPFVIYLVYAIRVLPGLRVFKHTMRGHSYTGVGRYREALRSFRRAMQLSPNNRLARQGSFAVHRSMDLTQVANDPEMVALVDFDICLERASSLLMEKPSEAGLKEVNHLLALIENQRPALRPVVRYWRAVALIHQREYAPAAEALASLLDPGTFGAEDAHRQSILFEAWQLAMSHPEMRRRVGEPELAKEGRRIEVIAAIERRLGVAPDDSGAWDLKRQLYGNLTEAEYNAVAGNAKLPHFDYEYAQQLGLALINDNDRWPRGAEYLRIAARGLHILGPAIFMQIAQAHERAGQPEGAHQNYILAQRAGQAVGPSNLSAEDQQAYFKVVKMIGDTAAKNGDLDTAIDSYHLYTEYERSGIETLRTLSGLYERKAAEKLDPASMLNALRTVEHALIYDSSDKDLLERKDRYYFSVMPEQLKPKAEAVRKLFDVAYCLRKAKSAVEARNADPETIEWGLHLTELALVMEPKNVTAIVLKARALLSLGRRDGDTGALVLLEDLREQKPEKFATGDDEESWYTANRILGRLYLDEFARPDLAVDCFKEFQKSSRSGADTLYFLGLCYEKTGDLKRAARYFEQVIAYDAHPRVPDAREALYRVQDALRNGQSPAAPS